MATKSVYLEYVDPAANSDKFWQAELDGKVVKVAFGRRGSTPQGKPKSFSTDRAAEDYFNKKVNEKLAKGYVDANGSVPFVPTNTAGKAPILGEPPVTDEEMAAARNRLVDLEAALRED